MVAMLAVLSLGGVLGACSKDVAANDLEVGDCSNEDLSGAVGEVDTVDCSEEHTAEVVGVYDIEGDDFPGTSDIQAQAQERCTQEAQDYVGSGTVPSDASLTFLVPTEETWNEADDRTVICLLLSGSPTTGSVQDA